MRFPSIHDPDIRDRVLGYLRLSGSITNRECRHLIGIGYDEAIALFNAMVSSGQIIRVGKTCGIRYVLPDEDRRQASMQSGR